MNDKALAERDSERDAWQETLDAVRDSKAGKVGGVETVELLPVVEARQKSGLSQSRFAELFGVSVRTLQDWEARASQAEQGRHVSHSNRQAATRCLS